MLDFARHVAPFLKHLSKLAPGQTPTAPAALCHAYYKDDVALAKTIATVFGEAYPDYLDHHRPKEKRSHKEYRRKVYENTLLAYRDRIISALGYIPAAEDFEVEFPTVEGTDTLANYCGESYSDEGNFVKWFFSEILTPYVDDPNTLELVMPERAPYSDQDRVEPRTWFIPSKNVWVYRKGKLVVALSPDTHELDDFDPKTGRSYDGYTLFIADHESYTICRQTGFEKGRKGVTATLWDVLGVSYLEEEGKTKTLFRPALHYGGQLPARKIGLKRKVKNQHQEQHFTSIISTALPHVRLAQSNQSDIQIEFKFHVGSQEWRLATAKCPNPKCKAGSIPTYDVGGVKTGREGTIIGWDVCPTCKGEGVPTGGPLDILYVPTGGANTGTNPSEQVRIPAGAPGGFIPRSIEPVRELVAEYTRNVDQAYTCVNMQFVNQVPIAQAGVAKDKDREEFYRVLTTNGAHLIDLMRFSFKHMAAQRYGINGASAVTKQLPSIMEPTRFNLDNSEMVRVELMDALKNGADATVIEALHKKYLKYLAGEASDEYRRYVLRLKRDPFRDSKDELKGYLIGLQLRNDESPEAVADIERIYLSIRFDGLVGDAIAAHPDFWEWDTTKQYDELVKLNKLYVGQMRFGVDASGSLPSIQPMPMKPPVSIEKDNQLQTQA